MGADTLKTGLASFCQFVEKTVPAKLVLQTFATWKK
jgi:hypothetical protein